MFFFHDPINLLVQKMTQGQRIIYISFQQEPDWFSCWCNHLSGEFSNCIFFDFFINNLLLYKKNRRFSLSKTGANSSGVTRGLNQGEQNLAERGPLATVGGATSQHSEKSLEMITWIRMSMSVLAKKTPRKTQKKQPSENQKNTKYKNGK